MTRLETDAQPFRHAATIYDSDEAFLASVAPFVLDGVASGEPVIVALGPGELALLHSAIGHPPEVSTLSWGEHYSHPLSALQATQGALERYLSGSVERVRIVGAPPQDDPTRWRGWARYESLCNHHFAALPVSALCPFDKRIAAEAVLTDVRCLHTLLDDGQGHHHPNQSYVQPAAFLADWSRAVADPLEAREPDVLLVDPMPSGGRHVAAELGARAGVPVDGLVIAVTEALANAYMHGLAPVTLRAWRVPGRVLITVSDAGPGPSDPFAGLLPPDADSESGRGLWVANQACESLVLSAGSDGCVVRITAHAGP